MTFKSKIRAIVADDSALTRRAICRMLESDPSIEVVSTAHDGVDAVNKAREFRPDVITLDINMPKKDGLSALQEIIYECICPAIMVSSMTKTCAVATFEALALGAFDCIAKPDGSVTRNFESVGADLINKVKAAANSSVSKTRNNSIATKYANLLENTVSNNPKNSFSQATKAIAIGISTGGPTSIMQVLPKLTSNIDAAVFLVQHMPVNFTQSFSKRLASKSQLAVVEAKPRLKIQSSVCYVGQGGRHLVPYRLSDNTLTIRCPTQPQTLFTPSVDVMMRAVGKAFGPENTIAVTMTGIGHDGAEAMLELKNQGAYTIAESKETAVVYGMPRAAVENGGVCEELPNYSIAEAITYQLSNLQNQCSKN